MKKKTPAEESNDTKILSAIPMTLHEFHLEQFPNNVMISQPFTHGYKVTYADGYISWCPKDIYNRLNQTNEKANVSLPTTLA